MIDTGQKIPAGMKTHKVWATLVEAASATSQAPLLRVRAAFVKDHTDEVPDKSFAADLKRKLSLRKVMHPDDEKKHEQDTPPEGLKFLKEDVNYRYASDPKRSCGECVHFRSGYCEIVSGLIRSVDTCDKFEGQERGTVVAVLVDTNESESEEYVGFDKLKKQLGRKGVKDPGALAAWIGRKKYGAAGMAKKSQAGRGDAEDEEVTPPGYEHVVKALKKKYDPKTGIPWAIAWSMKNRGIKPRKMTAEGGPGSGPRGGSGRSKFAPEEHEPSERIRVETPKQRTARIKSMKVDPSRAAVIRRALGRESVVYAWL